MACKREQESAVWRDMGDLMKGDDGVPVKDRSYGFRTYRSVFLGTDVVDWMINNQFCTSREEAIQLGVEMVSNDIFHHVCYNHTFKDEALFYRFPEDDPLKKRIKLGGPSVASLLTSCGVTKAGFLQRSGTLFWNTRYMMVKQDEGKLYYFTSDLEPAPKFVVELSDGVSIKEAPPGTKKKHFCFTIFSPNSSITFACKTAEDRTEWMTSLIDAGIDLSEEEVAEGESIYDFTCKDIDGNDIPLSNYKGEVCCIVNVAKLFVQYASEGFTVLAFPCNQFGNQEPGDEADIKDFATNVQGATFPLFSKIKVNSSDADPLWKFLKSTLPGTFGQSIKWNFTKFLIDRHGRPFQRYGTPTNPKSMEPDIIALLAAAVTQSQDK